MFLPTTDAAVKVAFAHAANSSRGLARFKPPGNENLVSVAENGLLRLNYIRNKDVHDICEVSEIKGSWLQYYSDTADKNDNFGLMVIHLDETLSTIEYHSAGIAIFNDGFDIFYPNGRPDRPIYQVPPDADLRWVMDFEE